MSRNASVGTIYSWLDGVAPFASQEDFDNAGLQVGHPEDRVKRVLLALDATRDVLMEAVEWKADLVIAHHPLLFAPLISLSREDYAADLLSGFIREGVALIAGHTNLDQSDAYSPGAALARLLGLENVRKAGLYLVLGELKKSLGATELQAELTKRLGGPVLCFRGDGDTKPVTTLAIAGGAYSEGFREAFSSGAQALLTGEVRHHHAVEAAARDIVLFEGGHHMTEAPMLAPLALGLQEGMNQLQYSVQVRVSGSLPYRVS